MIAIATIATTTAACAGQPLDDSRPPSTPVSSPTPATEPSVQPMASLSTTPSLTPTTPPIPSGRGADSLAQVVTSDLVQRSAPGTGPESQIYPDLLNAPTVVYVVDGPVPASGFDWYLVQPFEPVFDDVVDAVYPLGWVAAAGQDGEQWIAPTTINCLEPTFASLVNQTPLARLACHGRSPIRFEGIWAGPWAALPGLVDPSWISTSGYRVSRLGEPHPFGYEIMIHVPEGVTVPQPDQGTVVAVEVEGHFDDPAAQTCRAVAPPVPPGATPPPPGPLDDESVILRCRTNFVATSVEVISP